MTFTEQVIAALVGSFGGFVAALCMLWIKTSCDESRKEKTLVRNLRYELQYNINLLAKYSEQLTKCIGSLNADSKEIYLNINYNFVARHFAVQFYNEGLISKYLHVEDVKRWNDFLTTLSPNSEAFVSETVEKWRSGETDKKSVYSALEHERSQIQQAKELCVYLDQKIVL